MPYALRLSPKTHRGITKYIKENVARGAKTEVLDAIYAHLNALAANPFQGLNQNGPGVPLFRFSLMASDQIRRYLQVTYIFTPDEKAIRIISFGIVPM